MSRKVLLALLLAGVLLAAPLAARADDDAEEYDDEDEGGDAAAAAGEPSEKDVIVIGDKNWTEVVGKSKFALVEFYAPWCGHCQRLKPEWAKAATAIKEQGGDAGEGVIVGKVDATVEPEMAKKLGVSGYPTIKWFVDGELVSDYGGPREAEGITRWIKKKTGPPAATLADADALAAAEKDAAVLVVGFFKELKGAEHEAFTKLAQKTEDAVFAQTTDAAVAKAAGITASAPAFAVVANHPGEDRAAVAGGKKFTADAVEALVKENKLPVVVPFNDANSPKIFGSGIEKQVLLIAKPADLDWKAGTGKAAKALRSVAASYRGKLVFVVVDVEGKSAAPVTGFFGVKAEDTPVIVGFEMSANKKYRMAGDVASEKAVKKFADDLVANKLTPVLKSAEVPAEPLDEGVTVVVGKTFDSIVKDPKKDVLLEVYAPWCGHCKQLVPIYSKLAKRFAKVDSVVIAKMDGTENEHPDAEIKGYPTILFFPADKGGKSIPYDGDRSLKGFTKFLKKNAKIAYELPKKEKAAGEEGGEKKEGGEEEDVKDEL